MSRSVAIKSSMVLGLLLTLTTVQQVIAQTIPSFLGRSSCAAATCHGGSIDRGEAWNHSLSTWSLKDPHAGAALLLREKASERIVTILDPAAEESAERYDNVLRTRCISCHATASPADCESRGLIDEQLLAEGVSCEACHGPAEKWLESHVRVDWSGPERFEPTTGMRDTESIMGRAQTCVRCHIGSRTSDGLVRDMNHDLIAAGHPALRFDLLLYTESLPSHWDQSSPTEIDFSGSASRTRTVGRAIDLAAAAKLAGERAADHLKDGNIPWPELAEYDCFACHQSLSIDSFKLPPGETKKSGWHISDGLPIWNAWHAINQLPREKLLLKALSPHRSDPELIVKSITRVVEAQLDTAKQAMAANAKPPKSLNGLISELKRNGVFDWHEAAIAFLDIDAALRDQEKLPEQKTSASAQRAKLIEIVEPTLRFSRTPTPDIGATSDQVIYQSPARFNPEEFRNAISTALSTAIDPGDQANLTSQP